MKKFCLFVVLLNSGLFCYSQEAFSLHNEADQTLKIDEIFNRSYLVEPFDGTGPISGLVISGDIRLNSDTSLVRVILMDDQYREYLVYEIYPLLTSSMSFRIDGTGQETTLLDNIVPLRLRIEIVDASLYLEEIVTSKADIYTDQIKSDLLQAQASERINRINTNLESRNIPWVAGETSLSQLTYEEKKAYFGGEVPNLGGFEYYIDGIFVMPGFLDEEAQAKEVPETKGLEASPYVKEFSWRNVHGQNWVTPVKNQGSCGSCWAFAATGATELLVNLYYNQHLDMNLSEQQVVSCSGAGSCNGGYTYQALNYIRNHGLRDENCYPYTATNGSCSNLCQDPAERISFNNSTNINGKTAENLKKLILKGAIAIGIVSWRHAITLVGFKTLDAGDRVYRRLYDAVGWITIDNNSPYIGRTAWLIKNSWGTSWGDRGYAYVLMDDSNINYAYLLGGPVTSLQHTPSDIQCTDFDDDGYYTWGIGPKPEHCPPCPDQPDGDDSNGCLGPRDEYGNLQSFTTPEPETEDVSVFEYHPVPDLTAVGLHIRWYSDYELTNLVHTGNSLATGHTAAGIYTYYVTQTISDCESVPKAVHLIILESIAPPETGDVEVCFGDQRLMKATGENIRWYSDPSIGVLVHEGIQFIPAVSEPGNYDFYVTQTVEGIESAPAHAVYRIKQPPGPIVAENKRYCSDEGLFMFAMGENIKWYTSEYSNVLVDERDGHTYRTAYIGNQVWMAENLDAGVQIPGSMESNNNGVIEKYYFNDDADNGSVYGGLYQWEELMAYSIEEGTQGICPEGWHIPSNQEWIALELHLGMDPEESERFGLRGTNQGSSLKEGGNSGFEALMAGNRDPDGTFAALGYYTTFWNSNGYNRTLSVHHDKVYASCSRWDTISNGYSVRCVMDDSSHVRHGQKLDLSNYTPGDYSFLVTNTLEGCESEPHTIALTLRETPPPPVVTATESCAGDGDPVLEVPGENITWYHDISEPSFIDERDSREYDMVQMGNQVWMAENLNAGVQLDGTMEPADNKIIEKHYYNNNPALGNIYGGLYQWDELMGYTTMEKTRGICPSGWEVPSDDDWRELEVFLGMNQADATLYGLRGTDQGAQLKTGGATGFNVMMAGKRAPDGSFGSLEFTTFWNSSTHNRTFSTLHDRIFHSKAKYDLKTSGYSLRCIMNDSLFTSKGNRYVPGFLEPGIYEYHVTQTIDGCESARATLEFTLHEKPPSPDGMSFEICEGDTCPELNIEGQNIRWYSDEGLDSLLGTGNIFVPVSPQPGLHKFYVTQSSSSCESDPSSVSILVKSLPKEPILTDAAACYGEPVPAMMSEGEGISWYADKDLEELLHAGPEFVPGASDPGTYDYYVTQRLDGCEGPADTATLVISPLPGTPLVPDSTICDGEQIPEFHAKGELNRWYADRDLIVLLHTGGVYIPGYPEDSSLTFFVTATTNGCESRPGSVTLFVNPRPQAPEAVDITVCEGDTSARIMASGDNIRWYLDPSLTELISTGNILRIGPGTPGIHSYYVTCSQWACESQPEEVTATVHELPHIELGRDTTIKDDQLLILGPYPHGYEYDWNNGTREPYLVVRGEEYGPGDHFIFVVVSDSLCSLTDSLLVTITSTVGIGQMQGQVSIYPNPADERIMIKTELAEMITLEVIDPTGQMIINERFKGPDYNLGLTSLTDGIYIIRLVSGTRAWTGKLIKNR